MSKMLELHRAEFEKAEVEARQRASRVTALQEAVALIGPLDRNVDSAMHRQRLAELGRLTDVFYVWIEDGWIDGEALEDAFSGGRRNS